MIDIDSKFTAAEKQQEPIEGRPAFDIVNRGTRNKMGQVEYYSPWKKYVFSATNEDYVFDAGCLKSITAFMEGLK